VYATPNFVVFVCTDSTPNVLFTFEMLVPGGVAHVSLLYVILVLFTFAFGFILYWWTKVVMKQFKL